MNKVNYDKLMQEIISGLKYKPSLLLHSCCAPCSTACIERLKEFFDITVFYYNPNIDSESEFNLRLSEQEKLCKTLGVKIVKTEHQKNDFLQAVNGYEGEKEGGRRCFICYRLRLEKTAEFAKLNGYDFFTTTLTVSPLKNSDKINCIGMEIETEKSVKFLPSDFKKRGGMLRSVELSKQYGLYRQNYCGCSFSKREE